VNARELEVPVARTILRAATCTPSLHRRSQHVFLRSLRLASRTPNTRKPRAQQGLDAGQRRKNCGSPLFPSPPLKAKTLREKGEARRRFCPFGDRGALAVRDEVVREKKLCRVLAVPLRSRALRSAVIARGQTRQTKKTRVPAPRS